MERGAKPKRFGYNEELQREGRDQGRRRRRNIILLSLNSCVECVCPWLNN